MKARRREELPVNLEGDELEAKGNELATARKEWSATKEEAKESAADYKGRLKVLDDLIDRLADEVKHKRELRMVEVIDREDFAGGVVMTVRVDTGETIRSRTLTAEERQATFFAIGGERDDYDSGEASAG